MSETVKRPGIPATVLRLIAMTAMLLDHLWATVVPGNFWMTCVGRIAFPIYAFQIVEGFYHTADRKKYQKRLLVFAVISEVFFNIVTEGGPIFPFHQNTIFTLLLGLLAISAIDDARKGLKTPAKAALTVTGVFLLSIIGMVDYGWKGVLTVVLFYAFHEGRFAKAGQLVGMVIIHTLLFEGRSLPGLWDLPLQSLAVLALIPIWLYNGEKGPGGKVMQQVGYWFYPAHLVVLSLIYYLT